MITLFVLSHGSKYDKSPVMVFDNREEAEQAKKMLGGSKINECPYIGDRMMYLPMFTASASDGESAGQ